MLTRYTALAALAHGGHRRRRDRDRMLGQPRTYKLRCRQLRWTDRSEPGHNEPDLPTVGSTHIGHHIHHATVRR